MQALATLTPARGTGRPPAAVVALERRHENTLAHLWSGEQYIRCCRPRTVRAAVALGDLLAAQELWREAAKRLHPYICAGLVVGPDAA
jgi:hypothetical protein